MRFSDLDGASVGVWGAGREIASLAHQLHDRLPRGTITAIVLDRPRDDDVRAALGTPDAQVVDAAGAVAALAACDVVVRSPGVSRYRPELAELEARGLPITTATALWLAEREGRGTIGVTGTKGKSTTAALLSRLLMSSGRTSHLAGNIGRPVLDLLDVPAEELVVVELSSYQIADLEIAPQVTVITNLFAEHVDWHRTLEQYRRDKLRVFDLPGLDVAVASSRDPRIVEAVSAAPRRIWFGDASGWDADAAGVSFRGEPRAASDDLPLRGEHNRLNLCAALAALEAVNVPTPDLPVALAGFQTLPHRLEVIDTGDGIIWVDDSISTTTESAIAAVEAFAARPLVLIGGGFDREQRYEALGEVLAAHGAAVIGLPDTGTRLLAAALAAGVPPDRAYAASDLQDAVRAARRFATSGAAVLLSPAAPSYNSYRDFEERGDHFRALAAGPSS